MRNLLTLLTVTVLALRSLLPVGFMLASHAGEMTVVICTGHGAETVTIDADGKRVPAKPAAADHGLCAYASPGATIVADAGAMPVARQVRYATAVYRVARAAFHEQRLSGSASPRGPPSQLI